MAVNYRDILTKTKKTKTSNVKKVVTALGEPCRMIALSYINSEKQAEEIALASIAEAINTVHDLPEENDVLPWLRKIVIEKARDYQKHFDPDSPDNFGQKTDFGSDGFIRKQLFDGILKLNVDHREILYLVYVCRMSYSDIAEMQGIPEETVAQRISKARESLTSRFDDAR